MSRADKQLKADDILDNDRALSEVAIDVKAASKIFNSCLNYMLKNTHPSNTKTLIQIINT